MTDALASLPLGSFTHGLDASASDCLLDSKSSLE
jgi:hypothetical protein